MKIVICILILMNIISCTSGEVYNTGTDQGVKITYSKIADGTDRYQATSIVIQKENNNNLSVNKDVKNIEKEKTFQISNNDTNLEEGFLYPIKSIKISKEFQENTFSGIEFTISNNENIYAIAPGMVIFSGIRPSLGNSVFLYHNNGYVSIYTNLSSINYKKGDYVKDNSSIIGTANEKFNFELRKRTEEGVSPLNPKFYLKERS